MFCPSCGSEMKSGEGRYHYVESGLTNVYIQNCRMYECEGCFTSIPLLPEAKALTACVAEALVEKSGRLSADEVLFLRKSIGMTSEELSTKLRVDRVTVSRWENGRMSINGLSDLRLRTIVIERLFPDKESARLRVKRLLESSYNGLVENSPITASLPPAYMLARAGGGATETDCG